jgi:hypothetical protein
VSPDRLERVNVAAGGQAIVGAVTHPRHGAYLENQDQPYGTEHTRAAEPAADAPVWSQEAGRPALPEAQGQGSEPLQAARRRTRQRGTLKVSQRALQPWPAHSRGYRGENCLVHNP